jgi:hypothetical protein
MKQPCFFKGSHCGLLPRGDAKGDGVSPSEASGVDLGGSKTFCYQEEDFSNILLVSQPKSVKYCKETTIIKQNKII